MGRRGSRQSAWRCLKCWWQGNQYSGTARAPGLWIRKESTLTAFREVFIIPTMRALISIIIIKKISAMFAEMGFKCFRNFDCLDAHFSARRWKRTEWAGTAAPWPGFDECLKYGIEPVSYNQPLWNTLWLMKNTALGAAVQWLISIRVSGSDF